MMMASTSRGLLRCGGADGILSTTRRALQSTRPTPLPATTPLPVGGVARQFSASARNDGFLRRAGGFSRNPFHKTWLTQHQQCALLVAVCFTIFFFNDYFIPEKPEPGTFQWWINQPPSRTTVWYPKKEVEELEEEVD